MEEGVQKTKVFSFSYPHFLQVQKIVNGIWDWKLKFWYLYCKSSFKKGFLSNYFLFLFFFLPCSFCWSGHHVKPFSLCETGWRGNDDLFKYTKICDATRMPNFNSCSMLIKASYKKYVQGEGYSELY